LRRQEKSSAKFLGRELIPEPAHGNEVARKVLLTELLPEPRHVHVDRARAGLGVVAPGLAQEEVPAEHPARVAHEDLEEPVFLDIQGNDLIALPELQLIGVKQEPAKSVHAARQHGSGLLLRLVLPIRLGPAQERLYAREQDLGVERLGHVVVGADAQAHHRVDNRAARGEHEDGRAHAGSAQVLADLESVPAGEHDVEEHEVVAARAGLALAFDAGSNRAHLVALASKRILEGQHKAFLVLDDEDARRAPDRPGSRRARAPLLSRHPSAPCRAAPR
jgi:hypothetical protein